MWAQQASLPFGLWALSLVSNMVIVEMIEQRTAERERLDEVEIG